MTLATVLATIPVFFSDGMRRYITRQFDSYECFEPNTVLWAFNTIQPSTYHYLSFPAGPIESPATNVFDTLLSRH